MTIDRGRAQSKRIIGDNGNLLAALRLCGQTGAEITPHYNLN
jgi:hypothetical protein